MEGVILGIDAITKIAAIKTIEGARYYFTPDEWKGEFPAQPGMKVDYDNGSDGNAKNVYPLGKSALQASTKKGAKTKTAATLWALFLGALGAHKFYLGAWGWGLVYLIFCWTYIPLILAIVETVRYVTLSDESFQERYAKLGDGPFEFLW